MFLIIRFIPHCRSVSLYDSLLLTSVTSLAFLLNLLRRSESLHYDEKSSQEATVAFSFSFLSARIVSSSQQLVSHSKLNVAHNKKSIQAHHEWEYLGFNVDTEVQFLSWSYFISSVFVVRSLQCPPPPPPLNLLPDPYSVISLKVTLSKTPQKRSKCSPSIAFMHVLLAVVYRSRV